MPRRSAAYAQPQAAPGPGTAAYRGALRLGDEMHLWLLVALELAATALLRRKFRNAHGG